MAERLSRHLGPKTVQFLGAINEMRINHTARRINSLTSRYIRIKDRVASLVTFPEEEVEQNNRLKRLDTKIDNLYQKKKELIEKHKRLYPRR